MNDEQLYELQRIVQAAIDIAIYPPERPHTHVHHVAQVPWSRIVRLRVVLDEAGVDWRAVKSAQDRAR